jgi:hypothetical protein
VKSALSFGKPFNQLKAEGVSNGSGRWFIEVQDQP